MISPLHIHKGFSIVTSGVFHNSNLRNYVFHTGIDFFAIPKYLCDWGANARQSCYCLFGFPFLRAVNSF